MALNLARFLPLSLSLSLSLCCAGDGVKTIINIFSFPVTAVINELCETKTVSEKFYAFQFTYYPTGFI